MVVNIVCIGCQHNNYPTCKGTIMENGNEMNIENIRVDFICGQKSKSVVTDHSIKRKNTEEVIIDGILSRLDIVESKV